MDWEILEQGVGFLNALKGSKKPTAIWLIGEPQCFRKVRDIVEPFGTPVFTELARGSRVLSGFMVAG